MFGFDFDKDVALTAESSKIIDADATDLDTFARNGKLLLYHGLSDQGLSPLDTLNWYARLHTPTGSAVKDWARLFLIPGMTHCAGGPSTDQFDMLAAIEAWVENGAAPERIIARGDSFPGQSRPLCAAPNIARYVGGDPHAAESFRCQP